jgi:hypothetical protein
MIVANHLILHQCCSSLLAASNAHFERLPAKSLSKRKLLLENISTESLFSKIRIKE